MNDVVTKMTKNVSKVAEKSPTISMPKLTVPASPIITIGKSTPKIDVPSSSTVPILSGVKNKISNISDKKIFGFSIMNISLVFIVILILAVLGFNLFIYLAEGTDIISNIMQNIASILPESIARTFRLSAIGTEKTGEFAADTLDDVGNVVGGIKGSMEKIGKRKGGEKSAKDLEKELEEEKERKERDERIKRRKRRVRDNEIKEIALKQANEDNLRHAVENRDVEKIAKYLDYSPAKSTSRGIKEKGWCYIGEDRGFKSCVRVDDYDTCMSGKVYKTKGDCELID